MLETFSEQEVDVFAGQRMPTTGVDEDFARALHDRTDGVPLFVARVMDDLAATLGPDATVAQASELLRSGLPAQLREIIEHEFEALDAEHRLLLGAASVCGIRFCPTGIAAVADREVARIEELCGELAREQTWLRAVTCDRETAIGETSYAFRHAIYRDVVSHPIGPVSLGTLKRKANGTAWTGRPKAQRRYANRSVARTGCAAQARRP